jgi:predicted nucleic acid-binding protein
MSRSSEEMSPERYLVDTTLWVRFLRGSDSGLKDRLSSLTLEDRAFTCDIIIMEILRGAVSEKEFKSLREDFLSLPQLAIDHGIWEEAWRMTFILRKKGVNAPAVDVLISAVASHHKCTLLHADKHFELIAKYTDLKIMAL